MCRHIAEAFGLVMAATEDTPPSDNYRPHGDFSFGGRGAGFAEGEIHKVLVGCH